MPATSPRSRLDDDTFDAYAERARGAQRARTRRPGGQGSERSRLRRGGPRAPLALLPLIGLCAGVAIAYVAQTAHLTQAGYQESTLAAQQGDLRQTDARLADELARLRSPARIDEAAQHLGLRPPSRWAYVAAQPIPVAPPAKVVAGASPSPDGNPVEHVVEAVRGDFGSGDKARP